MSYLIWQQHELRDTLSANKDDCEKQFAALYKNSNTAQTLAVPTNTKQVSRSTTKKAAENVQAKFASAIPEQPKLSRFDESLHDIVKRKYRFLLAKLSLSAAEKEELIRLLMEREQIALKINDIKEFGEELGLSQSDLSDLQYELAEVDARIEEIIGDGESSERFILLKDSDNEQEEFSQYTLGITGLFPLDSAQQENVLITRLKHKRKFIEVLSATGYDENFPLTEAQQDEVLAKIEKALYEYQEYFLDDVRPQLEHDNFPMDQYTMLENHTKTEFEELTEELRDVVLKRGTIWNWFPRIAIQHRI